jgi:broad specificity phosphatase PhoE
MSRVHLVRHGETAPNKEGLALGQADVPLTDTGRWQAQRLADSLAGEQIAAVYSSPLQRALNTATPIAAACGLEPVVHEDLIEMNIGLLDGMPFTEIRERYPDLMAEWAGKFGADVWMPAGERLRDVAARSWDALVSIARDHPESDVVVVSHNFVILTALARALEFELSQFRRLRHAVAAVSVMEFQGDRVSVVSINDTCHLRSSD